MIVFHGPGEPAFLTALDKATGQVRWKTEETAINSPIFGSWATPAIVSVGGHDEMILPLPGDKIGGEGYLKATTPRPAKSCGAASGWELKSTPCRSCRRRPTWS